MNPTVIFFIFCAGFKNIFLHIHQGMRPNVSTSEPQLLKILTPWHSLNSHHVSNMLTRVSSKFTGCSSPSVAVSEGVCERVWERVCVGVCLRLEGNLRGWTEAEVGGASPEGAVISGRRHAYGLEPVLLEPLFSDTDWPAARFHHLKRQEHRRRAQTSLMREESRGGQKKLSFHLSIKSCFYHPPSAKLMLSFQTNIINFGVSKLMEAVYLVGGQNRHETHRSVTVAGDGGGRCPNLATWASGGHRYLDGAAGLEGQNIDHKGKLVMNKHINNHNKVV